MANAEGRALGDGHVVLVVAPKTVPITERAPAVPERNAHVAVAFGADLSIADDLADVAGEVGGAHLVVLRGKGGGGVVNDARVVIVRPLGG